MVTVTFYTYRSGNMYGFRVQGHAGYAVAGQDIVCAAVSVLAQTALLGLEKYLPGKVKQEVREGYLHCFLAENLEPAEALRAATILETMWLGLEAAAREYGKHLRLKKVLGASGERRE